jgi:ankyrin repeat protein
MKPRPTILLVLTVLSASIVLAQNSKQELNDQLWEAARKGDAAQVTALLDQGAEVNAKFRYGTTALFKAAERGNTEVVKVLLARGADASVKDTFYGATAMTWALDHGHIEIAKMLLEKAPDTTSEVLMTGGNKGNVELVQVALAKGGIKAETLTGALAATAGNNDKAQIAELLKAAGAKPPLQLDANQLQTYLGKYKTEQGAEISFTLQDGKLFATPAGQRPFPMMALDKTTFKPVGFEGLTVVFAFEGERVTNFTLKQGPSSFVYKKVEQ